MADHLKISFSRNQLNETVSDVENSPNRCLQLGEGDLSISGFPLIDGLFQCKETFCNFLLWHISIISILYRYYIQKKTDWLFTSSRLEWVYISCWAAQLGDEEPSTVIVSQVLLRAEWVAGMHMVVRYPSDLGHALFEAKCGRNDKCFKISSKKGVECNNCAQCFRVFNMVARISPHTPRNEIIPPSYHI